MKLTPAERAAKWRLENPEKYAASIERSRQRRKERWADFLAAERARYAADPARKLAQQKAARQAEPEKFKARVRRSHAAKPYKAVAHCAKRRAGPAVPPWADLVAIERLYAEAHRLTIETGERWEVDHEIPLAHELVSGLHVSENLRVIPMTENRTKFNRFVLD
ncbi:hypothetical protein [Inquilinus sp.]|uniref:hypothetical protein n=1 Tax=Inquilinus sp. TaxID=1932117 RepID=UPI0031D31A3C